MRRLGYKWVHKKVGRWVYIGSKYECSVCCNRFENALDIDSCDSPLLNFKYCPACGAYMGQEVDYERKLYYGGINA